MIWKSLNWHTLHPTLLQRILSTWQVLTASNILKGDCEVIHWHDIDKIDSGNSFLLDVRTTGEFNSGTIPGSINIPVDELRKHLSEIPKDKEIVVLCQVGLRGYVACRILMQKGYSNVKNLSGGYKTYHAAIQKQSNEDIYDYDKISIDNDNVGQNDIGNHTKFTSCGIQRP